MHHTTDHDTIRGWIEEHGGKPALVRGVPEEGDGTGLLEIAFGGLTREEFEIISWEDFFGRLESGNLAFVYDELAPPGQAGEYKFLDREQAKLEYGELEKEANDLPDSGDVPALIDNLEEDMK
ncbi:MAG: hypothetical protein Q8Q36_01945 [bacterium]|nr:hypothetical protein [bacterium]